MKSLNSAELAALAQRTLAFRNLLWLTAKDRTTGAEQSMGFWDDVGTLAIQVYDVYTGLITTRTFVGAGSLLRVEEVVSTSDLSVKEMKVALSGINASVAQAVRGYEPRLAPVQIYRLLLNPASGNAVAPARPRFVGLVDSLVITDPVPGGAGNITLTLVNQMRELTRANPDMTSDDSQKARAEPVSDRFYEYANALAKWNIMWGAHSVNCKKKRKRKKDRED